MRTTLAILLSMAIALSSCTKEELVDTSTNEITDIQSKADFEAAIANGISFVFFHASWCSNCFEQRPAVEATEMDSTVSFARFYEVEYEDQDDIIKDYKVPGFPSMIIYENGQEKKRFVGKGHSQQQFVDALLCVQMDPDC